MPKARFATTVTTLNIMPGNQGHVRYIDGEDNRVYESFRAPALYVRGNAWNYVNERYVSGLTAVPDTEVTLDLIRGGSTVATVDVTSDGNGNYNANFVDLFDNPVLIEADDTVQATVGSDVTSVQVPGLTAIADPLTDMVDGAAPADIVTTTWGLPHTLEVRVDQPSWATLNVTTTASGAYSADFRPYGGVEPGSTGWLRYTYDDGYVYNDFVAPAVYVRGTNGGYQADNRVSGYATAGDVLVTLNLQRGGNTVATAYDIANANGYFQANFVDLYGNAVDILSGDTVQVSSGGATTTVDVPDFDVTSDHEKDVVWGKTGATVVTDTYGLTQTLAVWPTSYDDGNYGKYVLLGTGTLAGIFTSYIQKAGTNHIIGNFFRFIGSISALLIGQ